jgi:hypothetical protein
MLESKTRKDNEKSNVIILAITNVASLPVSYSRWMLHGPLEA